MLPFLFLPPGHIKCLKSDKVPISRTSTLMGGREAKVHFIFCMLFKPPQFHTIPVMQFGYLSDSMEVEVKQKFQTICRFRYGGCLCIYANKFTPLSVSFPYRNLRKNVYTTLIKEYHSRENKHYTILIIIWFYCSLLIFMVV